MRVCSVAILSLLAAVLIPFAVAAQNSTQLVPVAAAPFSDVSSRPISLIPPQSNGEKSVALAVALNALLLPGVGNFYAGNTAHGLRHVGLHLGGGVLVLAGVGESLEGGAAPDDGEALLVVGALILAGNWVWGIVSGIEDARAAGSSSGSSGASASMLQPQFMPLRASRTLSDPLATPRLGLQLVRVTF
jgi:hypothetical protein